MTTSAIRIAEGGETRTWTTLQKRGDRYDTGGENRNAVR
jgi:hypothetical protein